MGFWDEEDEDYEYEDYENVDEHGWDMTPGQNPTFVGLP